MSKITIQNFADDLSRLLCEDVQEANDFASLYNHFLSVAIAGEQLRRASLAEGEGDIGSIELAAYDAFLESYIGPVAEDLPEALIAVLENVDDFAETPLPRDPSMAEDLLIEIDEVLCVAACAGRVGKLAKYEVLALGKTARDHIAANAPALSAASAFAEERDLLFADDPLYPDLFAFYEPLAALSPSRVSLVATLQREARRARHIKAAMAAFDAKHASTDN